MSFSRTWRARRVRELLDQEVTVKDSNSFIFSGTLSFGYNEGDEFVSCSPREQMNFSVRNLGCHLELRYGQTTHMKIGDLMDDVADERVGEKSFFYKGNLLKKVSSYGGAK